MARKERLGVGALIVAFVLSTSCNTASPRVPRYFESEPPRYHVSCPLGEECNEAVALLVGLSAPGEPTRCTAALIGRRRAITAAHCVAWELAAGGICDGVWLGFAESDRRPSEWIGCRRVAAGSKVSDTLLAPDYAVLELQTDPARRSIRVGRGEVEAGEIVRMVSVTADRFYDDLHQMRSRRCVVHDDQRLSPSGPVAPPSIRVLSSCPIREGSSGAPILDREGRMKGLVHAGGPPYFAFGLMTLLPQPVDRDDR